MTRPEPIACMLLLEGRFKEVLFFKIVAFPPLSSLIGTTPTNRNRFEKCIIYFNYHEYINHNRSCVRPGCGDEMEHSTATRLAARWPAWTRGGL